ncbi:MAG TPA: class I SAM-dependent methyltransferase [Actinomycetes bacterium]
MATGSASTRWADELAAWTIDPEILAAAPESPYGFPPALFAAGQHIGPTPLQQRAAPALRPGGTLLDVGAGAGAASLDLVPAGGHLHAVDSQPTMLAALAADARSRGLAVTTYDGAWPDVAERVPVCDVVVSAHVLYNVPDLRPFAAALTAHAGDLVVVELTGTHPLTRLAPMWEAVHHQPRPDGPTADLAVAVLRECGIEPEVIEMQLEPLTRTGELAETWTDFTRRQLCLPPERRPEVEELMRRHPARPRRVVVLAWPGTGNLTG